jgi:hypothetical protein
VSYRRLTNPVFWLTAGENEAAHSSKGPSATLKFYRYAVFLKANILGERRMILRNNKFPVSELAQRANDVLLVSTFAIWAMVLGFAPVLTYRLLVS